MANEPLWDLCEDKPFHSVSSLTVSRAKPVCIQQATYGSPPVPSIPIDYFSWNLRSIICLLRYFVLLARDLD